MDPLRTGETYNLPVSAAEREQAEQVRVICATFLTPEARVRLDRVSIVNPAGAKRVEAAILSQAQSGQLRPGSVTDQQVKEMLEAVSKGAEGPGVVVGSIDECQGDGRVVLQQRVDLNEDVKNLGDDELSF